MRGGQFLEPLDGCGFHVGGMGAAALGTEHGAGVGQEGTAGWSRAGSGGGSGQALGSSEPGGFLLWIQGGEGDKKRILS